MCVCVYMAHVCVCLLLLPYLEHCLHVYSVFMFITCGAASCLTDAMCKIAVQSAPTLLSGCVGVDYARPSIIPQESQAF